MASSDRKKINSQQLAVGFQKFMPTGATAQRLVPRSAVVSEFEPDNLQSGQRKSYSRIKSGFKQELELKDRRFLLSDLVADHLAVEKEERARFEKKVSEELETRLQEISQKAFADGHAEGVRQGKELAYEEERARIAVSLEKMAIAANALLAAKLRLGHHYEKQLVEMAFRLARVICNREITERPESINSTIKEILERMARNDDVRVLLSDSAFEVIDQIKEQVETLGRDGRISFEVGTMLKPGDCVVESPSGEIASFIDEKFVTLEKSIMKSVEQSQMRAESDAGLGSDPGAEGGNTGT